jgi:hypothetical protein
MVVVVVGVVELWLILLHLFYFDYGLEKAEIKE